MHELRKRGELRSGCERYKMDSQILVEGKDATVKNS